MTPGKPLLWLAAVWLLAALATAFFPDATSLWLGATIALIMLAALDALLITPMLRLTAERCLPSAMPVGRWSDVELIIRNFGSRPLTVEVFDHIPGNIECTGLPTTISIDPGKRAQLHYSVLPNTRGDFVCGQTHIRATSPIGLWQRNILIGETGLTRVYPDFAAVGRFLLMTNHNRTVDMGIRKRRRRGEGLEFHQLRDYHDGDSLRQIDWKATSRHQRLIAKEYQDERDQQVLFWLDCSRRMRARDDDLSHFDHALNAMLLLSYVAARQGDAVGMQTFGGHDRQMLPRKGNDVVKRMLNSVYDLQPTTHAADFETAAEKLSTTQRRRSLIVILTNLRDEDSDGLEAAMKLLTRRHLVLVANLREQALDDTLEAPIHDLDSALLHNSTVRYLEDCRSAEQSLRESNAMVTTTTPSGLAPAVVNRYLDIKRSGTL